jgi:biopolymer transport protein ExbD
VNFGGRNPAEDQFQIAPMIDVVFILLIWLVVGYAAQREEKNLEINLPDNASAAKPERRSAEDLLVNLDAKGRIEVERRGYTPERLEERLRKLSAFVDSPGVIIRADAECAHKHVVQVMDICERVEIRRVFFSAIAKRTPNAP